MCGPRICSVLELCFILSLCLVSLPICHVLSHGNETTRSVTMEAGPTATRMVAMFQGRQVVGEVQENLQRMKEVIRRAAAAGAALVIFPELFLTGYHLSPSQVQSLAEERNGTSFRELSAAAREARVAVLYGYPELDRSSGAPRYFNSAQLVGSDGSSLVNYRKLHLWTKEGYESAFTAGDAFADVVECCGLKVGILICYDVEFLECVRTLALRGAQVVMVPTALEAPNDIISSKVIPALAYMNEVCVCYVNFCGAEFSGRSVCCSRAGVELARGSRDSETLLFAPLDVEARKEDKSSYMQDRRPELYRDLRS